MDRSLIYFAVVLLIVSGAIAFENDIKPKDRKDEQNKRLSVLVRMVERGIVQLRSEVKVHFQVIIEKGIVKVNGKPTELGVVTRYELDAQIENSSKIMHTAPVTVHIYVRKVRAENGHQFLLEEEVKIVDGKKVKQLQMILLTMYMDKDGREYHRTTTMVAYKESNIRQKPLKKFCGKGDRSPQKFWDEPKLPDESGFSHHPKRGKGFCSKFHKLPFAARVVILVGVIFVLVTSALCCAHFCCRKQKTVYNIGKDEKGDFEIDDEEEAEPLPQKLAFGDKEVLIA